HRIGRGAILHLKTTDDGGLLIYPEHKIGERQTSYIELQAGPGVGRDIVGAYLYGYDVIRVVTSDHFSEAQMEEVKRWVRTLAGAEIVDETPSRVEIQIMLDPEAVAPEKVVRRQAVLVLGMVEDAVQALVAGDASLGRSVHHRDEEVDRHYFTLVRVLRSAAHDTDLARRLRIPSLLLIDLRMAAKFLEDAGDHAASIGREVTRSHKPAIDKGLGGEFLSLSQIVISMGLDPLEALLSNRKDMVFKSLEARREFIRLGENMVRRIVASGSQLQLFKAYYALDRICEDFSDIAELALPQMPRL
ncbi:MAG: phosphate uptake regulator PhoU, partial [Nitrososphaerota archaeon]